MLFQKKKEIKLNDKPKILFIALNGIGDLILATPCFANIKKNLPESDVSVLTRSDSVGVVSNNPHIDNIIIYPSKKTIFSRILFLLKLRKTEYDISFYTYPNVNIMSALLSFLIGAKCRINFDYKFFGVYCGFLNSVSIPVDLDKHDIEKNLDLLRALKLKIHSKKLFIKIKKADEIFVNNILKGKIKKNDVLIGMHVGSREAKRIWSAENFASLVEKLSQDRRIKIILVGTSMEMSLIKNFDEFKIPNVINILKKTTIPQTTALIKKCRLFITTDSGPMHMAVAVGTKVIAVYLGAKIKRTAPFGKKHIVFLTNKSTYDEDTNKNHIYVDEVTPDMVYVQVKKSLR